MTKKTAIRTKNNVSVRTETDATTEVSKVVIGAIAVFATLVGIWSLALVVGGLVSSGGVGSLLTSWWQAVTGG